MKIDLKNGVYLYIPEEDRCYKNCGQYVMHVIAPQSEGRVGGSDTHVLQLAIIQKEHSHYAPVVLFKRNLEYEKKLLVNNVAYICGIRASDKEIADALEAIDVYISIAIIHSHQYDANFLTQTIKASCKIFESKPTVMTCHGWIENTEDDIEKTVKDFDSYNCANALITVCQRDSARLQNDGRFDDKYITCIHNGVTIPEVMPSDMEITRFREKWSIPKQASLIGFVGRFAYEKRVDLIISLFNQLVKKRDNIYLLLVGSGDEEESLKKMTAKLGLNKKVVFIGYLSNPNIIYSIIDFLILTSDTEGTPRSVLESMSCGKMAVATNVGGLNEIIDSGKNGILLEKNDIFHWVNIIDNLLTQKRLVQEMNVEAKKKVLTDFSIINMCKKVEGVYEILTRNIEV